MISVPVKSSIFKTSIYTLFILTKSTKKKSWIIKESQDQTNSNESSLHKMGGMFIFGWK